MSRLTELAALAREVRLEPLREQFGTRIPLYLVPGDTTLEQELLGLLRPADAPRLLTTEGQPEPNALALHVVVGEASPAVQSGLLPLMWEGRLISIRVGLPPSREGTVLRVPSLNADVFREMVAPRLLELYPDMPLALASNFPGLKPTVVQHLIHSTAAANAQLAVAATLPAFVPVLGTLLSLGSELALLTKNQILLVYKLALVHGYGQDGITSILPEIASVIAGAFGWRYLARQLVGLLPAPLAVLPKAAVAYAGTYVVGTVADHYFSTGRMPRGQELAKLWRSGYPRLKAR